MSEPKVREVYPGVFVIHLPLPMRPTIVNVTLLHSGDEWALVDTGVNTRRQHRGVDGGVAAGRLRAGEDRQDDLHASSSRPLRLLEGLQGAHRRGALPAPARVRSARSTSRRRGAARRRFASSSQNGIPLHRFVNVPSPGEFWDELYRPTAPDHFMDDGDIIRVGSFELEVITTPGHTPGHCVLYLRQQQLMIVGDHLLPKITPHVGVFPGRTDQPARRFHRLAAQGAALRRRPRAAGARRASTPTTATAPTRSSSTTTTACRRCSTSIRRQARTAYDVATIAFAFDSDSPLTFQFPATFETLAHLEYLRATGKARSVRTARASRSFYRSGLNSAGCRATAARRQTCPRAVGARGEAGGPQG